MSDLQARPIVSNTRLRTAVDPTIASWSTMVDAGVDVDVDADRADVTPTAPCVAIAHDRAVVASGLAARIRQRTTWNVLLLARGDGAPWDHLVGKHVVVADEPSMPRADRTRRDAPSRRTPWTRLVVMSDDPEACAARHATTRIDGFIAADCSADALVDAVRPLVAVLHRRSTSNDEAVDWAADRTEDLTSPTGAGHARRRRGGLAPHALQRVRQHVAAHLSERIQTDELAMIARLSSCHFTRAFRQSTGHPPHRYVLLRRIHAAAMLVRDTQRTFADIAASIGFSDQSHFTRTFARITGRTPRAFRRQHR